MSDENSNGSAGGRPRRGSFTSQTFSNIFGGGRSNSTSSATPTPTAPQPTPAAAPAPEHGQRRRMSISTLGLSGTSPIQTSAPFFPRNRRASISTAGSDSIDESAIEDDLDMTARSVPTTPFARRMSFGAQALFNGRSGTSVGSNGDGLNWSEQFRSRAESAVHRPSMSTSPGSLVPKSPPGQHERARSISDMPEPPAAMPQPIPVPARKSRERRKPDEVGERMLRGEFYMD